MKNKYKLDRNQTIVAAVATVLALGLTYTVINQNSRINALSEEIKISQKTIRDQSKKEMGQPNNAPSPTSILDTNENLKDETVTVPVDADQQAIVQQETQMEVPPQQASRITASSIKYSLPDGWSSEINNDNALFITHQDGGYISITLYDLPANSGRRAYFCQVTDVCYDQTEFSPDRKYVRL